MKKNTGVIIIISIILIIVAIATAIILVNNGNKENSDIKEYSYEENGKSKLKELSEKLKKSKNYNVSLSLNKDNVRTTSKKGDMAKVEIINQGNKTTYIVKDEMTYMLLEENKDKVYKYKNNVALLNDFENKLDEILNKNFVVGTEEIDGKQYRYEEFNNSSVFVINFKKKIDDNETKTRIYFDGNDIKYIKTYIGDVEQLLKVELKYDCMKNTDFDIPEEKDDE